MTKPGIDNLIKLLDDDNEEIAIAAMRELLDQEAELGDRLSELQEADSPLLRKRIHQLQAAIVMRRRRRNFSGLLNRPALNLVEGLIEVHLQWYDNDSRPGITELWNNFRAEAKKAHIDMPEGLSRFMRRRGMTAAEETTLQPENYCIGTILENNYGSAAVLCGIAQALSDNLKLRIVRGMGEFGLLSGDGKLLLPRRDWEVIAFNGIAGLDFWDGKSLLQFASSMLFSNAVNSDSLRYIQTIAQALLGTEHGEMPSTLPYPYQPPEEEDDEDAADGGSENSQPQ